VANPRNAPCHGSVERKTQRRPTAAVARPHHEVAGAPRPLEPMIERAGFDIVDSASGMFARYVCRKG
jgi:hypothetical protein